MTEKIDFALRLALFGAAGYGVYYFVKKAQAQEAADAAAGTAGIPKDWMNDPVLQRDARGQLQTPQLYPRCQIFDTTFQFFLDAGDAESNASQDACFVKQAAIDNPRYLSKAGADPVYQKEDPLSEDPALAGTCYFRLPDGSFQTFPDFSDPSNPIMPVNRSERMCFGAGETLQDAGYQFKNALTGITTFNPFYDASDIMSEGALPAPPYCEQFDQETITSGTVQGWWYKTPFANFSESQCFAAGTPSNPTRWRTPSLLVFKNPNTGEEVALKNEIY